MASNNKAKSIPFLRWLWLLPIPVVWCVLDGHDMLRFLENRSLDWRFQHRGELKAPVKVVYVNVDSLSLSNIGNWPWARSFFATVSAALIQEAKVKAIGFDFVFSDQAITQSADLRMIRDGNVEFGRFLNQGPPIVLAAAYGGWQFIGADGKKYSRELPIVATEQRPPDKIEPPERAEFLVSADRAKPNFARPRASPGLIDTLEGGTRWVPVWTPSNERETVPGTENQEKPAKRYTNFYHMAVHLARLYWGLPPSALEVRGDRLHFVGKDGRDVGTIPLTRGQFLEVNWFSRWRSPDHNVHAEFVEVLAYAEMLKSKDAAELKAAKEYFAQDEFKDAIVLIGPVDPLLQDLGPSSLDEVPVPKVGLHGNLVKTIVSGTYLRRLSPTANYAIAFGLTLIVVTLSLFSGARVIWLLIVKVLAVLTLPLLLYLGAVFWTFSHWHLVLPFTAPIGAALTTSIGGLIIHVLEEQKAKGRIKGMFGAYVSPQLVERMVDSGEDPRLGGHEEQITAYFSDIQNFSSFSEMLTPDRLVELMNEYLTACTDIVQEQGGTLDKYIGDAVVAMYGAPIPLPDHAYRACLATQLVHLRLGELRQKWRAAGDRWPEIVWNMQSRIGLNSGSAIIGNMGSRTRFNYTMMGDNVNLAARMESGAKQYGVYTMVTEDTKVACEKHGAGRLVFRFLEMIVVKGRSKAVPIYEVVGLAEKVAPSTHECLEIFGQGVARYLAQDWVGAEALFQRSAVLEPNQPGKTPGVQGNPSLTLISRCHYMRDHPPSAGWDGVYVMKEK